ncbi:MAG: nucleotide pyrophosphohydrolase [Candidatus Altiarchaeota archaeon]|nr:nucleotide pyrophosphohydrolase [Candidatus Altiarchaeota archaeon]
MASFDELVDLMAYMRSPEGCPWDRKQKIDDFKKYLSEESREALDAIDKKDYPNLCEELGDLLWHILFISQIAKEEGLFTIDEVVDGLKKKIVRRHPHVFGEGRKLSTPEEVIKEYGKIKALEKKTNDFY